MYLMIFEELYICMSAISYCLLHPCFHLIVPLIHSHGAWIVPDIVLSSLERSLVLPRRASNCHIEIIAMHLHDG
jgi:hypothetical protein